MVGSPVRETTASSRNIDVMQQMCMKMGDPACAIARWSPTMIKLTL